MIPTKHVQNLFLLDPCKFLAKDSNGTVDSYTKIYEIRIEVHTPKNKNTNKSWEIYSLQAQSQHIGVDGGAGWRSSE
jgi:hypothetical protein